MPRVNDIASTPSVQAADYLNQGAVLIQQQPLLRRDHQLLRRRDALAGRQRRGRARLGPLPRRPRVHDGARRQAASASKSVPGCTSASSTLIAVRMSVAIRLRHAQSKEPARRAITLAMRLKGMGYEHPAAGADGRAGLEGDLALPAEGPRAEPRHGAPDLRRPVRRPCADVPEAACRAPVDFLQTLPTTKLNDALLFVSDRLEGSEPSVEEQQAAICTSCASATCANASAWRSLSAHRDR